MTQDAAPGGAPTEEETMPRGRRTQAEFQAALNAARFGGFEAEVFRDVWEELVALRADAARQAGGRTGVSMERVLLAILRGQPEGRAYRWLIELDHLLRTDPNDGPTPAGALCALADWLEALVGHVPPPAPDSGRDERWQTC